MDSNERLRLYNAVWAWRQLAFNRYRPAPRFESIFSPPGSGYHDSSYRYAMEVAYGDQFRSKESEKNSDAFED